MKYSVIIPVYNAESTLQRCIDSILANHYPDMEIILVNDGSSDRSWDICEQYQREFDSIVCITKENGGVSAARNDGIEISRGDFLCFVDSDDYVPGKYFETLDLYESYDLVVFNNNIFCNGVVSKHELPDSLIYASGTEDFIYNLVSMRNGCPWNKRFSGRIVRERNVRFPVDLCIGEDFVFCLAYMLAASSTIAIRDSLYIVDISSTTSLTRSYKKELWRQSLRVYEYAFEIVKNSRIDPVSQNELVRILDYNYCRTFFVCLNLEFKNPENNSILNCYLSCRKLAAVFSQQKHRCVKTKNLLHKSFQVIIEYKLCVVSFLAICLYRMVNK